MDVVTDPFAKSRKVYFKDEKIAFDGVPFSIIGSKVFDCQLQNSSQLHRSKLSWMNLINQIKKKEKNVTTTVNVIQSSLPVHLL